MKETTDNNIRNTAESSMTIVERNMLYDFYGELLTEHQREVYESIIFQDLSLSEAAEEFGISRQGVHDLVRRCDRILENYEEKLGLVGRFRRLRESAEMLCAATREFSETGDRALLQRIEELSKHIEENV